MHKQTQHTKWMTHILNSIRFGYHPEYQPVVYYRSANHHIKPKFVSSELQHACWSDFMNRGKIQSFLLDDDSATIICPSCRVGKIFLFLQRKVLFSFLSILPLISECFLFCKEKFQKYLLLGTNTYWVNLNIFF